jgi:hypothetical protein
VASHLEDSLKGMTRATRLDQLRTTFGGEEASDSVRRSAATGIRAAGLAFAGERAFVFGMARMHIGVKP